LDADPECNIRILPANDGSGASQLRSDSVQIEPLLLNGVSLPLQDIRSRSRSRDQGISTTVETESTEGCLPVGEHLMFRFSLVFATLLVWCGVVAMLDAFWDDLNTPLRLPWSNRANSQLAGNLQVAPLTLLYMWWDLRYLVYAGVQVDVSRGVQVDVSRGVQVDVSRGVQVDVSRGVQVDVSRGVQVDISRERRSHASTEVLLPPVFPG